MFGLLPTLLSVWDWSSFIYTDEHYVVNIEEHSATNDITTMSKHLKFRDIVIRFDGVVLFVA